MADFDPSGLAFAAGGKKSKKSKSGYMFVCEGLHVLGLIGFPDKLNPPACWIEFQKTGGTMAWGLKFAPWLMELPGKNSPSVSQVDSGDFQVVRNGAVVWTDHCSKHSYGLGLYHGLSRVLWSAIMLVFSSKDQVVSRPLLWRTFAGCRVRLQEPSPIHGDVVSGVFRS